MTTDFASHLEIYTRLHKDLKVEFPRSLSDLKSAANTTEPEYVRIASDFNTTDNYTIRLDAPLLKILNFSAFADRAWTHSDTLVFTSEILGLGKEPLGSCAPTKDYQWGFSFILSRDLKTLTY